MSQTTEEKTNNGLESPRPTYHSYGESRPPFELYDPGISEAGRGWIQPILAFLKDRNGGEVVAIAAIFALYGIAKEFIRNRNDGLDRLTLIGTLFSIVTILAVVILVIYRTTKAKHATHTQEDKSQKAEPGVGIEGENEDGGNPR